MVGIRFVTISGKTINVDATDFSMDIKRSVAPVPIPLTAERVAFDLNMVQVAIRINAILRDDDCAGIDPDGTAAVATLDFSQKSVFESNTEDAAPTSYMSADGGTVSLANLDERIFTLQTKHLSETSAGTFVNVRFDTGTAPASSSVSGMTLTVGISGVTASGVGIATALMTAFSSHSGNFSSNLTSTGGSTSFSDGFTSSRSDGVITLTQKEAGSGGNTDISIFTDENSDGVPAFHHTAFNGGLQYNCKSAGDKAQDLIANVANSNIGGTKGSVLDDSFLGDSGISAEFMNSFPGLSNIRDTDYIVGLRIPYNSLVQNPPSTTLTINEGYAPRNFIIVTGEVSASEQASEGNTNSADGTVFDFRDPMTGISGTVVGVNISYDAGETTYQASIDFQPLDLIGGI